MARKPNLSTETIARQIKEDDAARRAKAAVKRTAKRMAADAAKQALISKTEQTPEQVAERKAHEAAAAIKAMAVDYQALHELNAYSEDGTQTEGFTAFLVEMGFKTDGTVSELVDAPAPKAKSADAYSGPMLALRDAAKHYVTGKNGNPHCADQVAMILDGLTREQVVDVLGRFLLASKVTTSVNPYLHLNPGQQSMNLRNKLRGALKNGTADLGGLKSTVAALTK